MPPRPAADPVALARTAGLRDLRIPRLEEVDKRRAQLWGLSLLVSVAVPAVMVAVGLEGLPELVTQTFDLRTARLALLAMLVVIMGYVAEREVTLRRLTGLLVEERVLTASLVNRVDELNLLVRATRAMNSALDLSNVLDQITESAHGLLKAGGVTLLLADPEQADVLRVVTTYGSVDSVVGQCVAVGEGLAGLAADRRDALLASEQGNVLTRGHGRAGETIAVPMEVRGKLLGILTVEVGQDRERFTEFDLRGVSVFANAAAAAIANARAYEDQIGQVATLLEADQAKDEFLTLVTHELRTPLTSMIGLLGTLSTRSTSLTPDQVAEFAAIGQAQGWRLDRLIGDLLDTSRAQSRAIEITPSATSIGVVLGNAVRAMNLDLVDRQISLDVPADLVREIDADLMLRVTDNLLSNACKYTPQDSPIEVVVTEEARGVRIDVVDHGPGIPADLRQSLFDKFTRGPDPHARGGLGLGLYVVHSLAVAHHGRVELHETPGGGATFSVWLGSRPVSGAAAVAC